MSIQQSDIFADTEALKTAETKIEKSKCVPIGYIPVAFCSKNVMGPEILHFRNYSMAELLELASSTEENQINILVNKVLNSMCYEKFDCAKLHIENIKEILLNIYLNFWNNKLLRQPYYIDPDREDYDREDNIGYTDIDLKLIHIKDVNPAFKNPFTIIDTITNNSVKFCVPNVEQMLIAEKAVKVKYYNEEQKYSIIKSRLDTREALTDKGLFEEANKIVISFNDETDYADFKRRKNSDYIRYLQSQLIVSINGTDLDTIESKIQAFDTQIDATTWLRYTETIQKYADFGVDELYKFDLNDKVVTRRFSFRYVEFIPSVEQRTDTGYSVRFDD